MPPITHELARLLEPVHRSGGYCTSGTAEILAPGIEVDGIGPVALPLLPGQAERLIAVAEQAPYGRGPETLVDTAVRRTWQIDAGQVKFTGRHWPGTLGAIVARVADGLGVDGATVEAEFYKLLVYEAGGFFLSHRDTEKADGMFATLVIVLPSVYEGGELVVRHGEDEARFDLRSPDPAEVAFAAFYADCRHEVLPLDSGFRPTLIYNLVRRGSGPLPEPPGHEAERERVAVLLKDWSETLERSDASGPDKLVHPLEHAYTQAGVSFAALKGADAARAAVLATAAERAGCDLHLALLTIEESGSADYGGGYGRWSRYDEDDYEVGELCERSVTLSEWRRPDDGRAELGMFPFEDQEGLSPPDALDDLEPDELDFQEASGNAGASFERSYRRAALVLWPAKRRLVVLARAGLGVSLPWLESLAAQWEAEDGDLRAVVRTEALDLVGLMLESWPERTGRWWNQDEESTAARMLTALRRLGDGDPIEAFLTNVCATGDYGKGDNAAIIDAATLLPPGRAAEAFFRLIAGNAAQAFDACAELLARASRLGEPGLAGGDLGPAAGALLSALPEGEMPTADSLYWTRPPPVKPGFVADLMAAFERIDAVLADQAAEFILARPAVYGFDDILVPAVLSLAGKTDGPAVRRLRAACLAHLGARIAEPLAPPGDWSRDATLSCRCSHCADLARFLGDAGREAWSFKAVQAQRAHVEDTIRRSRLDVDTRTLRKGSPHTLVCTKNQASYERRVEQREQDLANLVRLEGSRRPRRA